MSVKILKKFWEGTEWLETRVYCVCCTSDMCLCLEYCCLSKSDWILQEIVPIALHQQFRFEEWLSQMGSSDVQDPAHTGEELK